jgi:hypothetical protein
MGANCRPHLSETIAKGKASPRLVKVLAVEVWGNKQKGNNEGGFRTLHSQRSKILIFILTQSFEKSTPADSPRHGRPAALTWRGDFA